MKLWLLVLGLVLGLGSCFSFSQVTSRSNDPFARYLARVKGGTVERSFVKFSTNCTVDVSKIQPRFAIGAGSQFSPVGNLAKGLRSLDTDFYSTAEVWVAHQQVVLEIWANSDDVGSETRYYECFTGGKLIRAEVVVWKVPVEEGDLKTWGYFRKWELGSNGDLKQTKAEFVDAFGLPTPKPKLDSEDKKSLQWTPFLGPLDGWKLPQSTLR